jgi:large subunit ribosomal protein L10
MNREEKKSWIDGLKGAFEKSQSMVVAAFKGLSVAEISDLRTKARKSETLVKVTQNRLTKLALKGTGFEGLSPLFKGSTLIACSPDLIASAKVVFEFAKGNDKLTILGGAMGSDILDSDGVKGIALTPSLDESRAKICAILQTPGGNIARTLKAYSELNQKSA